MAKNDRFKKWVFENGGMTATAKQLGVSLSAVSLWVAGKRVPRPEHIRDIIKLSGGQVKFEDLLFGAW